MQASTFTRRSFTRAFSRAMAVAIASGSFGAVANAATITVPGDAPNIAAAVTIANNGDEIVVANGTWAAPFTINGIDLTIRSASGDPTACIISVPAVAISVNIVGASADVVIQDIGFQQAGRMIDANGIDRLRLDNCRFNGSQLAAVVFDGNVLRVDECRFVGNSFVTGPGGALIVVDGEARITRSRFEDNAVDGSIGVGGALAVLAGELIVADSVFNGNTAVDPADGDGGAIYLSPDVRSARIASTSLADNTAGSRGGAMYIGTGNVELSNIVVRGNTADAGGGLFLEGDPEDCGRVRVAGAVIDLNASTGAGGGGIRLGDAATLEMVNATVVFNGAVTGGAGVHVTSDAAMEMTNSIVGSNLGAEIGGAGSTTVQYSNVQDGWPGPGNIDDLPQFVDAFALDYRLAADSPCIDAGNSAVAFAPSTDLDGQTRSVDDPATPDTGIASLLRVIDMGAYEFQPDDGGASCPTDIDGSGETDFTDLLSLLAAWGVCP